MTMDAAVTTVARQGRIENSATAAATPPRVPTAADEGSAASRVPVEIWQQVVRSFAAPQTDPASMRALLALRASHPTLRQVVDAGWPAVFDHAVSRGFARYLEGAASQPDAALQRALQRVRALHFDHDGMDPAHAGFATRAIRAMAGLPALETVSTQHLGMAYALLQAGLPHLPALTGLDFNVKNSLNAFEPAWMGPFRPLETIVELPATMLGRLRSLNLSGIDLEQQHRRLPLAAMPQLESLSLVGTWLSPQALAQLPLAPDNRLRHLNVSRNPFGNDGVQALLRLPLAALRSLNLANCGIQGRSFTALVPAPRWKLENLNLAVNFLYEGAPAVLRAFDLSNLKSLNLSGTWQGGAHGFDLANAGGELRALYLRDNGFTADQLHALPYARLSKLQTLDVSGAKVDAQELADLPLRRLPQVRRLGVSSAQFAAIAVQADADGDGGGEAVRGPGRQPRLAGVTLRDTDGVLLINDW